MYSKTFFLLFLVPTIAAESGDYDSDVEDFEYNERGVKPSDIIDDEDYSSEFGSGAIYIDNGEDNGEEAYIPMKIDEVLEEVIISSPDKTIIEEIVDIVDKSGNEEFESEIIEIKTPLTSETVEKVNSGSASSDSSAEGVKTQRKSDVQVTESDTEVEWFEQKHLLAALIAGAAAGVLFATLVVILCIHRIRKKDEGSYSIDSNTKYNAGFKSSSGEKRDCEVYA